MMLVCIALVGLAVPLFAQSAAAYVDDFQSYGTQKNPPGWVDTSVGSSKPTAGGLYKTWPDPLQGNKGPNVVFGTKQSSGKPEGNNPRIGTFSTLSTKTFSGTGRFEYRGRFIRTNTDSRVGFTFFSAYPELDKYYLLGTWTQPSTGKLTMQLFGFGGGVPSGKVDSNFTPDPNKWYAFVITAEDLGGKTYIKARFWLDTNTEPTTWSIDAIDATASRLTQGRIGIWSAVKGEVYVDDLNAKSPIDHAPPVISVIENQTHAALQENARFRYAPSLTITATDDGATQPVVTRLLDGAAYTNGTAVTGQGNHTIYAKAVDDVGNVSEVTLHFYVDTLPPTVIVNTPQPNAETASAVTIDYQANDATPPVTVTGLLNNAAWTPLSKPITAEGKYQLSLTATDGLGNSAPVPTIPFTIDLTPPQWTLSANGQPLTTDGRIFSDDVRITLAVTDLTATTKTLLLDDGEYVENAPISAEGTHRISATVKDAVGHVVNVPQRTFIIDKSKPVVTVLGNGQPMQAVYDKPVELTISINDTTATTTVAKLNQDNFTFPGTASAEKKYTLLVTVTDAVGHATTLDPIEFTVDLTAPKVTVLANGQPFKATYTQDVNITVTIEDVTATSKTITLDQQAITPPTSVSAEEPIPHVFSAVVSDAVGRTTTIDPISFTIDKTAPAVTIRNGDHGPVIDPGQYFNEAVHPFIDVDDRTTITIDAKLNGNTFVSDSAVTAEGTYTLTGSVKDVAGNTTPIGPLTFHIDTTPPVGVFMEGTSAFPDGQSVARNVSARVKVTDNSAVTTEILLDGEAYVADTPITSEALHTLTATLKDAAGNTGTVPSVSVRIDRTPPDVSLEANDQAFPHDFAFNKDFTIGVQADDASGIREKWAVIDPGNQRVTVPHLQTQEGSYTVTGYATDNAGNTGHTEAIHFVLEKTPPQVFVKIDGQDAVPNFPYNHDVRVTFVVADGLTSRTINATLDGQPYTADTLISQESTKDHPHVIAGTVTTGSGLIVNIPVTPFILDKTRPTITLKNRDDAFPATGSWLNEDVVPVAECDDTITRCTVTLTLDGASWTNNTAVTIEKPDHAPYRLVVSATDDAGNTFALDPIEFVLDKTKPVITIAEPANDAVLTTTQTLVRGTLDDAITLQIEGVDATIDAAAKTFVIPALPLTEGENVLTAVGIDRAGNAGTAAVHVIVDTTGPQLTIRTPAPNSCVATADLVVTGVVTDANIESVRVSVGEQSVANALAADHRNWTATFPGLAEGAQTVLVEARDAKGHRTVASLPVFIDRGAPVVEILEGGAPFTAKLLNRPVALTIRVTDLDPSVRVLATYRGAPYTSGTVITGDGLHHLDVVALDCAGHQTAVPVDFTISTTAPVFHSFIPPKDAVIGTAPAVVGGNVSGAVLVEIEGTQISAVPNANGDYVFTGVAVNEGKNTYSLRATDAAGNVARDVHSFTVKSTAPTVEILEGGVPLVEGKVYTRPVTLTFRSNDPEAHITATRDSFTYDGEAIDGNGEHVIIATATDQLNHSGTQTRRFVIDRTAPVIDITSPAPGPVSTASVDVDGNAGDAQTVTVNGVTATINTSDPTHHTFHAPAVPLDLGENLLVAIGTDAAGNSGIDQVLVTWFAGPGIIITSPPDGLPTNRPRVDVIGRTLSPVRGDTVTIGSKTVAVDGAGGFRFDGYQLAEGPNTITVKALGVQDSAQETTASVHVNADFTPPALTIIAGDKPLVDDAQFPSTVSITTTATDAGASVPVIVTIDGVTQTAQPIVVSARGGHVLTAFASDEAGNETRINRTFFIGSAATASGCSILSTDPKSGAIVTTPSVTIAGIAPGAATVKVAGVNAQVADGTFVATIDLPNEGANPIAIQCSAGEGLGTGSLDITLNRVTGAPTVEITDPAEGFVTGTSPIDVRGHVTGEVKSVAVNGVFATLTGTNFEAKGITLAGGVNILVATARSSADRIGNDSVRVTYLSSQPSISITSPLADYQTGASTIALSGAWSDLDPSTLAISASGATRETPVSLSHTNGTFRFLDVPLANGQQTLTVTGRDVLGRTATANVKVTRTNGLPSLTIAAPKDNAYLPAGTDIPVNGAFVSDTGGERVDVNSTPATVNAELKTYAGATTFSTTGATTPIVARLTDASNNVAFAAIRVHQLANDFVVTEAFPPNGSLEVSPGVIVLVSFSHPVDLATLDGLTLTGPHGVVTTTKYAQETIVSLSPTALLEAGGTYTLRAATSLKDVAGTSLKNEFTSTFTVANTGGGSAPTLDDVIVTCGKPINVTGTASPGARLLLETGPFRVNGTADAAGKFSLVYPSTGQSGWQVVRVRVAGVDGSLSPAAEKTFRIDCAGPRVVSAAFDRSVNNLTINFSKPIKPETIVVSATGSVVLTAAEGAVVAGTATTSGSTVSITPAEDLSAQTFTLFVSDDVTDTSGAKLVSEYTQIFSVDETPTPREGDGYISGEVYDATNGRPLKTAQVTVSVPATAFARTPSGNASITSNITSSPRVTLTGSADTRGRYTLGVPEGAHTIEAGATSYTTAWRQIIVPAGAGVVPIDIRLTQRGQTKTSDGAAIPLEHGGENAVTRKVRAAIPAGVVPNGSRIALTSVGAQSLAGLLPLGWSPLASAELAVLGDTGLAQRHAPLSGAQLTFELPNDAITASQKTLSLVQYDEERDEWITLAAVMAKGTDGNWSAPIATSGAFAVVYADAASGLEKPSAASTGAPLQGVEPNCGTVSTPCALAASKFDVSPKHVSPTQSAIGQLEITGTGAATFPSGTAVQAYVSEVLNLPGGGTVLDAPFATDLLLYRALDDSIGVATFNIAPSANAKNYVIQDGVDHIQILHYPGRLDRGTLIGSEGGSVPGDDAVSVEIPSGATLIELHASSRSLTTAEQQTYGPLEGFEIVGGLSLSLSRAEDPDADDADHDGQTDAVLPVELTRPARVTATVEAARLPRPDAQILLAEVIEDTPWNRIVRLAVPMSPVDAAQGSLPVQRFTTRTIDPTDLPVDGVIREGRYLLLAAKNDLAWATGILRIGAGGPYVRDGKITSQLPDHRVLGVTDLTRPSGRFAIPVSSQPGAASWSIIPRDRTVGAGAEVKSTQPAQRDQTIRLGDVILEMQPPQIEHITPDGAQPVDVTDPFTVRIDFNMDINAASARSAVTIVNRSTNENLNGDVTVANDIVTFTPRQPLIAGATYVLTIASSLTGTNGAPFGHAHSVTYTTLPEIRNTQIHEDRVHISVPNAGVSRIWGDPGALPAGWLAVPVRRGNDFIQRYNTTVGADGSFSVLIGNGPEDDRITQNDIIELQAINAAGNVAAIIRLTPFVTEDGLGFIAPANAEITFTSKEGITLHIPEGAFTKATLVTVAFQANNDAFKDVPNITNEMDMLRAVKLDFEGVANRQLDLTIPLGTASPDRPWLLAQYVDFVRGPRVAIVDMFRVEGTGADARLTTTMPPAGGARSVRTNAGNQDLSIKSCLIGISQPGYFAPIDLKASGPLAWITVEFERVQNIMMDLWRSIVVPDFSFGSRKNCVAMPVIKGVPFTITGVDGATGLDTFKKVYQPIPLTDPGVTFPIENPNPDSAGPYPIYGTPFRVESVRMLTDTYDGKGFHLEISSTGSFSFTANGVGVSTADRLAKKTLVRLYNVTKAFLGGEQFVDDNGQLQFTADVDKGDDIVLFIGTSDVPPETSMSVVFSEPFDVGTLPPAGTPAAQVDNAIDNNLRPFLKLELLQESLVTDLTEQARFGADTQNRRLRITMPATLVRGGRYRLTIKKTLADPSGNKIGSKLDDTGSLMGNGGTVDFTYEWVIRSNPDQVLGSFVIRPSASQSSGMLRDIAKSGNLAFVAAAEGGVLAYDLSDPAALNPNAAGMQPLPISFVPAADSGLMGFDQHWSVAVDQHGRVFSGGLMPSLSAIRSYRVEDFLEARDNPQAGCSGSPIPQHANCKFIGATVVGFRPGYASGMPLSSGFVTGDSPEAYPKKIELFTQDETKSYKGLQNLTLNPSLVQVTSDPPFNASSPLPADTIYNVHLTFQYPWVPGKYLMQRITVRNDTLDLSWSKDVYIGESVTIDIIARKDDLVSTLRNDRTFALVNLFGYGAGVYDMNGVESNDVRKVRCADAAFRAAHDIACDSINHPRPAALEMLMVTPATKSSSCNKSSLTLTPDAIPHLNFSPTMHGLVPGRVVTAATPTTPADIRYDKMRIFGLDNARGVLDLTYQMPNDDDDTSATCATRPQTGLIFRDRGTNYVNPRLANIQTEIAKKGWSPRFSDASMTHWEVPAESNGRGLRGSRPGKPSSRDYMLVAGGAYGLLVVEVGGIAPEGMNAPPSYEPLTKDHLADVIWIPAGAVAVRAIPKTNLATVLDGKGRLLLVDLSNIDQRWSTSAPPNQPATMLLDAPFPITEAALAGPGVPDEVGVDDPRIIYKSPYTFATRPLAPILDPETGIAFGGELATGQMKVAAVLDPAIEIMVDAGKGLTSSGGVVPLGVEQPLQNSNLPVTDPDRVFPPGALAAFRVRVSLPGAIAKSIPTNEVALSVESERVYGADTEQTPLGMPRAHLRKFDRANVTDARSVDFKLRWIMPNGTTAAEQEEFDKKYRHMAGYNHLISDWIVAIADPRASVHAKGTDQEKRDAGCIGCIRPLLLKDKTESADHVYELFTKGRFIAVRPGSFGATKYNYLNKAGRLELRVPTTMADTVREKGVLVAGLEPPIAQGALQETTYLHSGEVEVNALDMILAGRASSNIPLARTYRSRTIGGNVLGLGWEAPYVRRLRQLPDGNVEYRDGAGEIWVFKPLEANSTTFPVGGSTSDTIDRVVGTRVTYESPKGLFLKLIRNTNGWMMFDQKWRFLNFDNLGRLVSESDEFWTPKTAKSGNIFQYLYDAQGRLSNIVDPVGRITKVKYWKSTDANNATCTEPSPDRASPCTYAGLLGEFEDWRDRKVTFEYDKHGRMIAVQLPAAKAPAGSPASLPKFDTPETRPRRSYTYQTPTTLPTASEPIQSTPYTDFMFLAGNLESITDPQENAPSSSSTPPTPRPRVKFQYYTTTYPDHVQYQKWPCANWNGSACAEREALFSYSLGLASTLTNVIDILGQQRDYDLAEKDDGRYHVTKATVLSVPVMKVGDPAFPATVGVNETTENVDLVTTVTSFNDHGGVEKATLPNGVEREVHAINAAGGAPGKVVAWIKETKDGRARQTIFNYDPNLTDHPNAAATVVSVLRSLDGSSSEHDAPSASRDLLKLAIVHALDLTATQYDFDIQGRLIDKIVRLVGAGAAAATLPPIDPTDVAARATEHHDYFEDDDTASKYERGNVEEITSGSDLDTTYQYAAGSTGGLTVTVEDKKRKSKTVTIYDSWDRVVSSVVTDNYGTLASETFAYDATGNLIYHSRAQKDVVKVENTAEYDVLGRTVKTTSTGNEVLGNPGRKLVQTSTYDLAAKESVESDPFVEGETAKAENVRKIDAIGRTIESTRRVIGGAPTAQTLRQKLAYDIQGLPVYVSDLTRNAMLSRNDAFGRTVASKSSDGLETTQTWDSWNLPVEAQRLKIGGGIAARSKSFYTPTGRLFATNEKIDNDPAGPDAGRSRQTHLDVSDGGRSTTQSIGEIGAINETTIPPSNPLRMSLTLTDSAGRVKETWYGDGTGASAVPSTIWQKRIVDEFSGNVARAVRTIEPQHGNREVSHRFEYDALGNLRQDNDAGYITNINVDEAGNVNQVTAPGNQGSVSATYDGRGLQLTQTKPGGTIQRQYDAMGTLRSYRDEQGKTTTYTTDDLGRVTGVAYPDGTTETMEYDDAGQTKASQDRAGTWFSYQYDAGGRVLSVHNAHVPNDNNRFVVYQYDDAKRISRIANKDASIEYSDYDMLGRPGRTTTRRYANGTGLKEVADQEWLDVHSQKHTWSIHDGERLSWTMPVVGDPASALNGSAWLTEIREDRDASLNVVALNEVGGAPISAATASGVGRVASRSRSLAADSLKTTYGFADDPISGIYSTPQQFATGVMRRAETAYGLSNPETRAGSDTYRTASNRIGESVDLGLAGRVSTWSYDGRGRLLTTNLLHPATGATATPITDHNLGADFRDHRQVTPLLTDTDHTNIGAEQSLTVEPLEWSTGENNAHAVANKTTTLDATTFDKVFQNEFGRRTSNGEWTYAYDDLHRVIAKENGARRIEYVYDPNSRIVARHALSGSPGAWSNDPAALMRDGIPARTTWEWDPTNDRLLAMYVEGASTATGAAADAGLLRQYVHGDRGVDDLIEIRTAAGRFYPIFDEAGTGSLQATVGADGNLVERVLYADAFGDAPRYLQGAVVDRVTFSSKKNPITGKIEKVDVRMHVSEKLRESTVNGGVRLVSLKVDGTVIATALPPELEDDEATLHWELNGTDWESFTGVAGADRLEIAVNNSLRAQGWGDQPIQRVPDWATKVFAGVSYDSKTPRPVVVTFTFAELATKSGDDTEDPLYEIKNLYMAASVMSKANLLTDFHGYPYREPADGTIFVRARWYDPATGAFLTPDPVGYRDSSNLYAFCANDPVNCRDPFGLAADNTKAYEQMVWALDQGMSDNQLDQFIATNEYTKDLDRGTAIGLMVAARTRAIPQAEANVAAFLAKPRVQGTIQAAFRCSEMVIGGFGAETGIGVVAFFHGMDGCVAGLTTLVTGERQRTYTSRAIQTVSESFGASPEYAEPAADIGDEFLSIPLTIGASIRPPRIVYRALTVDDARAIAAERAMVAKAPQGTWTASEHIVNMGPGSGGAAMNSPWLSTSRRLDVAMSYDSGYGVVAIDLNRVPSLSAEVWRITPRTTFVEELAFQRSFWAQEVTIYQQIPFKAILGFVK